MELEEGMVQKIALSTLVVAGFLALILLIGLTYGENLGTAGGLALVGSIALFVVVMAAVGLYLAD